MSEDHIINCVNKWLENVCIVDNKLATGHIDGKQCFDEFMREYRAVTGVSFNVRSSRSNKLDINSSASEDEKNSRLYWCLNTKSHPIPFIGSPFMVRHSEIRHCIFGKD